MVEQKLVILFWYDAANHHYDFRSALCLKRLDQQRRKGLVARGE